MKCTSCGSSEFHRPAERSALEIWHCTQCGNEVAVHCNYTPNLSKMQPHELFVATVSVEPGEKSLKALFKLKKALAFAERFDASKLEAQQKAGELVWDLGYFLDFEVKRAEQECLQIGVQASFNKVNE